MNKSDFTIFQKFQELVYLDNSATTQKPISVIQSLGNFYNEQNSNVHRGIYKLSELATSMYETGRQTVADFIGAEKDQIIFTSGTTASINLLAEYFFRKFLPQNSTILLSDLEHHSNILPWQCILKEKELNLEYIHLDENLYFDLNQIEKALKTRSVSLVSITLMSNVTGYIPPIKRIKELINQYSPNTLLLLDAAQAIAHMKIDVKDLGADFIVFSAHKVYGPTGLGVIWGKSEALQKIDNLFVGGGIVEIVTRDSFTLINHPQKFEAGTPPIAEVIALAKAIEYVNSIGIEKIQEMESNLAQLLHNRLQEIPNIELIVKEFNSKVHGPIISFTHKGIHPHDIAQKLDYKDIAVRAGHHCTQILHREVLNIPSSVRISLGIYNDEEDINKLIEALKSVSISH